MTKHPTPAKQVRRYLDLFPFVRRSRYIALSLHCLREQKRAQDAEYQVNRLLADNVTLSRLYQLHKEKADRLEYQVNHPRKGNGQFNRIIPITTVELKP